MPGGIAGSTNTHTALEGYEGDKACRMPGGLDEAAPLQWLDEGAHTAVPPHLILCKDLHWPGGGGGGGMRDTSNEKLSLCEW